MDQVSVDPEGRRRACRIEGTAGGGAGRWYSVLRDRDRAALRVREPTDQHDESEDRISAGHAMARGVTVARLTLDQLVLVRIQAGQQRS